MSDEETASAAAPSLSLSDIPLPFYVAALFSLPLIYFLLVALRDQYRKAVRRFFPAKEGKNDGVQRSGYRARALSWSNGDTYKLTLTREREMFLEVMEKFPGMEVCNANPEVGQSWHRSACICLMRRAVANLELFEKTSKDHTYFQGLYKRGFASLTMWESVEAAWKAMNHEMQECMVHANSLRENWGRQIFAEAAQIKQREMVKAAEAQKKQVEAVLAARRKKEEEEKEKRKVEDEANKKAKEETRRLKLANELIREEDAAKAKEAEKKEKMSGGKEQKSNKLKKGFLL